MNESKFWEMIQDAHDKSKGDMDEKCELIESAVGLLSKEDAMAFSHLFTSMMDKAYTWPLWGAAYIINGGCSDDGFTDFRSSLISRGRFAFDKALADPDSLADIDLDEEEWLYEGYQYAISNGVETVAGACPDRANPHPENPSGTAWAEDDVYDLYPRLSEKFA